MKTTSYSSDTNFNAAPLIQSLKPVVFLGPSVKRCPKCPPQELHLSSTRL